MAEQLQTVVLKIRNRDPLVVSKRKLTVDSPKFRYLIDELKYEELLMDDFSADAVTLFMDILEDKNLGDIEDVMFREIHKLAVVFEVEWLQKNSCSWLRDKIKSAVNDGQKSFVFEECWYILKKWKIKDLMEALVSYLAPKDNSSFISVYMSDIEKLERMQINLMLKLGGSHTELFSKAILSNLVGKDELCDKVKHLLQKMNLALCCEQNEELYLDVFEAISNLSGISVADMRLTHQLRSEALRGVYSRREKNASRTIDVYDTVKNGGLLNGCRILQDITRTVSENLVSSIQEVVELLLHVFHDYTPKKEDKQIFVPTLESICTRTRTQKLSQQYADHVISALNYSTLEGSDQLLTLLNEIRDNEKVSTCHENVIIKRDDSITVKEGLEYKEKFVFKHPGTGACTEPGKCGFILRYRCEVKKYFRRGAHKGAENWQIELCTSVEDYTDTGIHFHDIISANDMYWYNVWSGTTGAGNRVTVAGSWHWWLKWLPYVTNWRFEQVYVAYNVADYLVAKNSDSAV